MRQLCDQQSVYACSCSRAQIAALHASSAVVEADDLAYPGTCRSSNLPIDGQLALRLAVPPGVVSFVDRVQGRQAQEVAVAVGDFVVRRRDGIFAYHLATVVDDSAQAITEIVRGFDLVLSTPRQIVLQRALGLSTPAYGHVPMAVDRLGNKLSKSSQSIAITVTDPSSTLWLALQALCQSPPLALRNAPPAELWRWAGDNWSLTALQGHTHCLAPAPEPT
jgi:glutamyl-Q tRNA(Asp) synthetase